MKHIRRISVTPAPAFEVQPNLFLRLLELLLQRVVVAQLQEKKEQKAAAE
ncbi:MAG: hypothetical protein HUU46_03355 [Candidatus Hydrogenedentes bacterium]|nr:hypothetical protein [Candidatus Hydrogenedentota bacterium]